MAVLSAVAQKGPVARGRKCRAGSAADGQRACLWGGIAVPRMDRRLGGREPVLDDAGARPAASRPAVHPSGLFGGGRGGPVGGAVVGSSGVAGGLPGRGDPGLCHRGRRRRHDVRGLSCPAGLDAAGLARADQRALRAGGRAGTGAGRGGTSGSGAAGAGRLRRGLGALLADRGQSAGRMGRDGGLSGPLRGGGGAGPRGAVAAGAHGDGALVAVAGAGGHRGALDPRHAGRALAPAAGGTGDGRGDALGDAAAGAGWRGAGLRPSGALGRAALVLLAPAVTVALVIPGWAEFGGRYTNIPIALATGAVSLGLWLWLLWRAFRRPSAARPPA